MSSVQERLQLKRVPLDKWSIKEQLCLATAVACSGDQNWMSVSRSLKMLCPSNRPSDWFSQKSCAAQYGKLLENVETPKRKKRTISERDSTIAVDTPSELILRKLTQERITELKRMITEEQQQYAKINEDILSVQTADESKLREMWNIIETENNQKEKDRYLHSLWLKEREEKKLEMERAWRPAIGGVGTSPLNQSGSGLNQTHPQSPKTPLSLKIKSEEMMEIDDPSSSSSTSSTTAKPGTSPLLTSLLKSPSPVPVTLTTTPSLVTQHITTSTSVRNIAPTITNLLTSNIPPGLYQGNIINEKNSLLVHQQIIHPASIQSQNITQQSNSASAPTLSMLLENTQPASNMSTLSLITNQSNPTIKAEAHHQIKEELLPFTDLTGESQSPNDNDRNKEDDQHLMDVFNGLIPDNIDELADILTDNNAIILTPEMIDEESILDNVNSLIDEHEEMEANENVKENFPQEASKKLEDCIIIDDGKDEEKKIKEEITNVIEKGDDDKEEDDGNKEKTLNNIDDNVIEFQKDTTSPAPSTTNIISIPDDDASLPIESKHNLEPISSELDLPSENNNSPPSSDNDVVVIEDLTSPPSIAESDSSKNEVELKPKIEPLHLDEAQQIFDSKNDQDNEKLELKDIKIEDQTENDDKMDIDLDLTVEIKNVELKHENETESETQDVNKSETEEIIIKIEPNLKPDEPIEIKDSCSDSEINLIKSNPSSIENRKLSSDEDIYEDLKDSEDKPKSKQLEIDQQQFEQNAITLIDTDDDSPMEVIKEDKSGKLKRDYSRKKSDNQKSDEYSDEKNESLSSIRTKLKERERSESPLVLDEDNDEIPRTRRRYSSTPNTDSIPNSPSSSSTNDDRDHKIWKKGILLAYNRIISHKYSSLFMKLEENHENYRIVCLRPIDLPTIKKNIETGLTRSTIDFQHDVMLLCLNSLFLNSKYNREIREFQKDAVEVIELTMENWKKDDVSVSGKGNNGSHQTSQTMLSQATLSIASSGGISSLMSSSSPSPLLSQSSSMSTGKGRGGRKSSRMSNI